MLIYAQAMQERQDDRRSDKLAAERTAIRDELRKMKDFPALEGFDFLWRQRDALKTAYVIEMKDGRWNLLARYPANG
jgi:branched-chain amino acid transport system substrate-binding protein